MIQELFVQVNAHAMGVKTTGQMVDYSDKAMRTFVFTSQSVYLSPPEQITGR